MMVARVHPELNNLTCLFAPPLLMLIGVSRVVGRSWFWTSTTGVCTDKRNGVPKLLTGWFGRPCRHSACTVLRRRVMITMMLAGVGIIEAVTTGRTGDLDELYRVQD